MKEILKSLNIIYIALIGGQLILFAIIMYLMNGSEIEPNAENLRMLRMFIPVVSVSTVAMSYALYNKRREQGAALENLAMKTSHYRVSNILRWAIVESGNMFALLAVFLTGSNFFLIFFLLGMGVFIVYRPNISGFVQDYSLSSNEERVVRDTLE